MPLVGQYEPLTVLSATKSCPSLDVQFGHLQNPPTLGGEGVLIGVQTATLNAQVTFVNIAVAISALAGAAKMVSHRTRILLAFARLLDDSWVSELKKVWRWNFGSFWEVSGNGKTNKNEKTL